MDLNEYQDRAAQTDLSDEDDRGLMIALLGLAGEVGELAAEQKKRLRDGDAYEAFGDRVAEELGDLLWYVAGVARRHGLDLETVAARNLAKNRDRWQRRLSLFKAYDARYPEGERLPRRLSVRLEDVETEGGVRMVASIDGEPMGAALTDNARDDDGYRFHDVMHLAHVAVLGWSPVIRAITGRKRKSDEVADEVEDGGRAAVVEEGIVALVWTHARERSFYEGVGGVDYELLRTIKGMTAHLEVADRSPSDWERAVLTGYDVWRQVRAAGGGLVTADLEGGTLVYEPLPNDD